MSVTCRAKEKIQIHVEVERIQYLQFLAALRKLGYTTVSELMREHIRRIIAEAAKISQEQASS
jgi:hypothetical protein